MNSNSMGSIRQHAHRIVGNVSRLLTRNPCIAVLIVVRGDMMVMQLRFRFEPHLQQLQWINPYAREKLFGGAKRGGESAGFALHLALLCIGFPGNRGLLARKNMTDLLDSTLFEFEQIVPK